MSQITMTIPDESVKNLAPTPDEASARLRMLAAVKLFEMKELSSGAAARLAGIPRLVFLERLKDFGVATFQQSEQELLEEMRNA
jgi:predicted HTH domain antitoxin